MCVRLRPYKTLDNRIDGAVITFIDIDEIKEGERTREALAKERRLAAVVRDSNDAITVQDLEGNISAWNPAAERIYGYTEQEAVGMNIRSIVSENDQPKLLQLLKDARRGKPIEPVELERVAKDGRSLRIWLVASVLSGYDGRPVAVATTERPLCEGNSVL